ncbi:hypothetical protein [Aureimonas sp. ME7]|uniref:hypothetical protein n=1 Tax=Aureimonas sp. ME7 TaxID=2744252 RepID=UPI0015F549D5|nr:hypothetical protein [Aureimonas sp. ME7]
MSAMEESLRKALKGGDATDPAFREGIYQASERALERMLEGRGADAAEAAVQRAKLAETIGRVEADHAHLAPAAGSGPAFDEAADATAPGSEPYDDEDARAPRAFAPPETDEHEDEGAQNWTPGGDRSAPPSAPRDKRSPLAVVAAAVVFALVLAILAYFVGGMIRGSDGTTGADGAQTSSLDWITVFDGDDLENLSAPSGGRIEAAARADGREAVRVSGPSGGEGEVLLAVGPGVVSRIAGSNVRVEIRTGSPDGAEREFSIRCLFNGASLCERQRFSTTMSEDAFIFEFPLPADAKSPASIAIAPGIDGTANDVDVFSLRLRRIS